MLATSYHSTRRHDPKHKVNMNAIFGYMLEQHTSLPGNLSGDRNTVSTWTGMIQMGWIHSHCIFLTSVFHIQTRKTLVMVILFKQINTKKKLLHGATTPHQSRFSNCSFWFYVLRYLRVFSLQTEKIVPYITTDPHLLDSGIVKIFILYFNNILPLTPLSLSQVAWSLGYGLDDQTSLSDRGRSYSLRDCILDLPCALSPMAKRPERETDNWSASSAKLMNTWCL